MRKATVCIFLVILCFFVLIGCQVKKLTIAFDANGGNEIASIEVSSTDEELDLPIPTRTGYAFLGWYASLDDTEPFEETNIPESDITLYAKWLEVDEHNIYYYDNSSDFFILTGDFEDYVIGPENEFHALIRVYTDFGQLNFTTDWTKLMNLAADESVANITFGDTFTILTTTNSRIFTFGDNYHGELGNGNFYASDLPEEITSNFAFSSGETIEEVHAGKMHAVLLTSNNRLFTWGYNSHGQLGNSTLFNSNLPIDITDNFSLVSGETITNVYAVDNRSFAITSDHNIFAWGNNERGELGDNSLYSRQLPVNITEYFTLGEEDFVDYLVLGGIHSMAVTAEGKIFTWGNNFHGQLGDGTGVRKLVPTDITNLFEFEAGEYVDQLVTDKGVYAHNLLLTSSGRLFAWGFNLHGQIGDNSVEDSLLPVDITSNLELNETEKVEWIGAINMRSAVYTSEGRVFNWGFNQSGQLANANAQDGLVPIDITEMFSLSESDGIKSIQMGVLHTILTTDHNRVFVWGGQQIGTSDNNDPVYMLAPSEISPAFQGFNRILMSDTAYYLDTIDLHEPTKTGYIFAGWYLDEERTLPLTSMIMPNDDLTLYAKWIPVE
ncbi:MAG: InlB B-repeat-containing protein [Bacilli bacterium]|nr:InlB B-repeat-containing protein [Bacilli bacterium]